MVLRLAAGFDHPVPMAGVVPKLSRTPGSVRAVGPALGEHTDAVLRDLAGLTDAELRPSAPPTSSPNPPLASRYPLLGG